MTQIPTRTRDFFDRQVSRLIVGKYGLEDMSAVRSFIESKTYTMLIDPDYALYTMSPNVVFDMWESERVTGDPRNSQYIRDDGNEQTI
jgi:hypothetical protein